MPLTWRVSIDRPALCTISGKVVDRANAVLANQLVRVRFVGAGTWGGEVFGDSAVASSPTVLWTDAGGLWSTSVPQGATVMIEIPCAGIRHAGVVPAASTAAFIDLFPDMVAVAP